MSSTPSPYLADWERVPSTAILTVTYSGTGAPALRVRVSLNSAERGLVGTTESPVVSLPGGPSSFLYNVRDVVFDWTTLSRNPALTDGALRTGQIPEGTYRACARVFVGTATTPVTEACADFSIIQPDPPQLLAPSDDQVVVSTQPFFQWTPVLAPPSIPVEYELTVVELIGRQVPRVALDANIPVLRQRSATPFLIYPIDALPLERTKRYAWRVRAVDDAGRQLFRDGAQSEIWSFEMSDDLLKPVGRIADLPDEITLLPGVARLTGVRDARISRTETEVELDGTFQLEFLGAPGIKAQRVSGTRLRAGFRGDELTLLSGRVRAEVPEALIPAELRPFITFSPMDFAPTTGFTATASLTLPGAAPVPMAGSVQLTANGLFGRLEIASSTAAQITRIGRAPVQFAATTARVMLPLGRLEIGGSVQLFEQEIGCAASGPLESGLVHLSVLCDPTSGLRPDPASPKSLIAFGTLAGSLVADFQTDTLGTELRAPATFSVLGEADRTCAVEFTLVFERGTLGREDERSRCEESEATRDLGWVLMRLSRLRLERLEYAPDGTFGWRARVDMRPVVRGAAGLGLPAIVDALLDETGILLPATGSEDPITTTSGYQELAGIGVQPRSMGFKGGRFAYAAWLEGRDPGFEWGSGASAIRFPNIPRDVSLCVDGSATEVDTLTLRGGVLDAQLTERRWESGCLLSPVTNFRASLRSLGGRVTVALDEEARLTTMPTVTGGAVHPRSDCGIPVIGCVQALNFAPFKGEVRLTPRGRLIGALTDYLAYWSEFDLKVAKLKLAGGALTLGVDDDGAQTAIYDGDVTMTFDKVVEDTAEKKEEEKKEAERPAAEGARETAAAAAAKTAGSLASPSAAVTKARIDIIAPRLLDGKFELNGPFRLSIGFAKFLVAKATLDVTGVTIDGRQRALVSRTVSAPKAGSTRTPPDSTYTERTDTLGATFDAVRIDPESGDVAAGTITLDGRLALQSSPSSTVVSIGNAATGGALDGGAQGALSATQSQAASTNAFGFSLTNSEGAFDPTGMFGNIQLSLPSALTIDAQGMRISGVAPARAAFGGTQYAGASVSFENGFAMRPAQGRVTEGRALLKVNELPVAYLDASGWHVALSELVATVVPDTLFLPDQWSAYVVLRNAQKQLLVDITETPDGPRIRTRAGTPVRMVVPALKGNRTAAPQATVAMDLTLARGTWRPVEGEIIASSTGLAVDDFSTPEIPFQLDSITFRVARGATPDLSAHGRLDLWQGDQRPMRVALGLRSAGELFADLQQTFVDSVPLVGGSSLVQLHVASLRFTASGKLGAGFQWRLETPGRLSYYDAVLATQSVIAQATLRVSPTEAALVDFVPSSELTTVRLPGVDLRLGRVRAPTFRWDFARRRFDFELMFDVGLMIPALDSLALPEITEVRLTPQGLTVPSFEMASTPVPEPGNPFVRATDAIRVGGFSVKALAYRVSEFRWDWFAGAPPPQFDFGVDLEFGVEDIPSGLEGQAARLTLRALNVGVTAGRITGTFERIDLPTPIRTPVADIRGAFGAFRVAEGELPQVDIGLLADLRLPDLLACPDAASRTLSLVSARDTLFLAGNGLLRGAIRDVVPGCPLALGPFNLQFGESTVRFAYDPAARDLAVTLDAAATLQVPGDSPGETVSATGRLVLDIANARVMDASIAIAEPFFWAPAPDNPFLRLVANSASLTQTALRFGATGQLRAADGAGVDVAFEQVAFDLNSLKLTDGRIRITASAAVGFEIPSTGALLFGMYPVTAPRGGTASARLVLPSGALIDSAGLHIDGSASASLGFGGTDYAALVGSFANEFTIATNGPVAIRRGRIELKDANDQLIAYADSLGFWPGNVFAVLPVPARLGLPSEDVAYIQLRDPANPAQLLIETVFTGETVRLRTTTGQRVTISLPALARGGPVPTVTAELDLVLNSRTMLPVSGGIALEAAPGQSLLPLPGFPVQLTQLSYAAEAGTYRLRADARAVLPGPLAGVDLRFRDLEITAQGLTGQVELGTYAEVFDPRATPIAQAQLLGDTLTVALTGARLTLGGSTTDLRISGGIRSSLFRNSGGSLRPINLTASVDANGFRGTADLSDAGTPIPIGVAELTLEGAAGQPAVVLTANATEFAITLGGALRLPTLAPGFALGVQGLTVGSAGVRMPNISITAPTSTQEFDLFGARFALRDSVVAATQVAPAIGIAFDRGVMRFTLSGYVTLLENTTRFIGLQFGTDGAFALQGADFLSRPIDIVPDYARLVTASIASGALELRGDVRLPAPFTQQAPQELMVRIRPDGQVTGGGRLMLVSEAEGLATAQTKVSAGVAAFHLRHLDVAIDLSDRANTAVQAVADIYVQEKQSNLLRFGSVQGGTVTAGLRVAASGAVTWNGLSMPGPIALDMDPVTLTFTQATATSTATGFAVSLSGGLGLKLDGATGKLNFRNVGFTSAGAVQVGQASFDGGAFTIQDKVRVTVGSFGWSDADSSIYVPKARPPGANGEIVRDSALVAVSSFITLGGSVDVAGVFTGGVDRVLVYVSQSDATTHLLVENLQVEIPEVLKFKASLSYDQLVDGFDMAVATEGTLLDAYRIGLVGVMGQRAGVFRAGVFLRTSLTVPIVPGIVTLSEVGGGLFVNPLASDLAMVKRVAGLNGAAANLVGMPPAGAFAVMLYAAIDVAGANGVAAASGRALVTITDKAFQINATATFFSLKDQLTGDLAVQVGWTPAVYVRGAVALDVKIEKTVRGTATVQFFAGSNVFAVKGNMDLVVVDAIKAYAEVIVVPSGFTTNLGFRIQKATSVVSVDVGGNLRIWYRPSTRDLGAYLRMYGTATAFGATPSVTIVGALVLEPEFAIYGQGTAQIVGVDALRVDVWVQYKAGGLSVGLGRNDELARVIARAEQIAADLRSEADAILAAMSAADELRARTPIAVSEASLVAAFNMFQRADWLAMLANWGRFRFDETRLRGGFAGFDASDYYSAFYQRTLQSSEPATATALVRLLREEAEQKLSIIGQRRQAVEARIAALRLELDAAESAAEFLPPEDPVTRFESGSPKFVEGPADASGKRAMTVVGAPELEVDARLSTEARTTVGGAKAATDAREARMRAQITAVEAGLATVLAATSASDPSSFASYARLHSDAVEAIEHQHAANVDFRMRRRAWAQAKLDTLAEQRAGVETRMQAALAAIPNHWSAATTNGVTQRFRTAEDLDSLARNRASSLASWSGDQSILSSYESAAATYRQQAEAAKDRLNAAPNDGAASGNLNGAIGWFQDRAVELGMQTWWGVANAGLTVQRDGAQALVNDADAAAQPVIAAMRTLHARVTEDLVDLNTRQAALYGVLFDLYDAYLRSYGTADGSGPAFDARRALLTQMLETPTVVGPRVVVTDFGYLTSVNSTWQGTHPRGVYEYLVQDGAEPVVSVGAQGEARRWFYTTSDAGATLPRNQQLLARGGAGLTGRALTPYSVTFRRGVAGNPVTQVAVPPVDLTPPSRPTVEILQMNVITSTTGASEHWTSDPSRVVVRWNATDAESGISEYEYRVVTFPPIEPGVVNPSTGGAFSDFLNMGAYAVGTPTPLTQWTSAGGQTTRTITGLALPPEHLIHVEVRARNGAGILGLMNPSTGIRYDDTPPTFPAGASITPATLGLTLVGMQGTSFWGSTSPSLLPTCGYRSGSPAFMGGTKVWSGNLVTVVPNNGVVGGGGTASMIFNRPLAEDPETGVEAIGYRIDNVAPSGTPSTTGWTWNGVPVTGSTLMASGPGLEYGRPIWISIVAWNAAGGMSAPLAYGPFTVADPTVPTAPDFCGDYSSGGFIAYMIAPSTDTETGVRGYQMRVLGPTGAIVRDFPANGVVDWPATQANAGSGIRLAIGPVGGGLHSVELRAVSGLGVPGAIARSGTMETDLTPPPLAGVAGSVIAGRAVLDITIADDPESGIGGMEIAVGESGTIGWLSGAFLMPVTPYAAAVGANSRAIVLPPSAAGGQPLWAYVRVRNGAGRLGGTTITRIR